ncbi:DUF2306 domain-containing protein [Nocardia wallacei]|uniref:DUF2306 domain-containing protein n=1 Tax=Nocardia wallacei TaxID=480035 RepID=A0A7G1KEH9_9NOCA|nr:DUF2306 domain-containing protein [Nocardia wallacei]BCK53400.1 hypothetical protein NWFMUON74_11720 [Nocardia wallacei]
MAIPVRTNSSRRWWQRPWVGPLLVLVVAFVAFSLPPYLTLDPARSRVPDPGFAPHYPLLVVHVVCGSIAILLCGFQVWPWFRRRYSAVHRRMGRWYVFAGVLPAGLAGVVIGATSPFGPVARVSNVMLALLWLAVTITGWRAARRRRFADHRRWMIRSFALTLSIILNRLVGGVLTVALSPQLHTTFHGDEQLMTQTIAGIGTWLGWTSSLLVAEWWLERGLTRERRVRGRAPVVTGA